MSKTPWSNVATPRILISLDHRNPASCERPAEILKGGAELFLTQGSARDERGRSRPLAVASDGALRLFLFKEEMLDALAEEAWGLGAGAGYGPTRWARTVRSGCSLGAILSAYMRFWLRRPDDYLHHLHAQEPAQFAQLTTTAGLPRATDWLERLAKRFEEAAKAGLARESWRPRPRRWRCGRRCPCSVRFASPSPTSTGRRGRARPGDHRT